MGAAALQVRRFLLGLRTGPQPLFILMKLDELMADGMFARSLILPDLGAGSGYFVWAFRACAGGQSDCGVLADGYRSAFGADGGRILGHILGLSRLIEYLGERRVRLGMPGCVRITPDEVSLLATVGAAQHNDQMRMKNHLKWILAKSPSEGLLGLVEDIGLGFLAAGMIIHCGDAPRPHGARNQSTRVVTLQGGRA